MNIMRSIHAVLCLAGVLAGFSVHADDSTETTTVRRERYLGVVTEPLPAALAAQLKDVLPSGRGLLVKRVLPDSPAFKAGVQPHDILITAGTRPLSSSDQLKDAVHASAGGRPLKLEYIRGAKGGAVDVTPADRTVSRLIHRHAGSVASDGVTPDSVTSKGATPRETQYPADVAAYSVGVQTRDGRHFQVEVTLSGESAEPATQNYAGTQAEIAAKLKQLPEGVQRSVLRQVSRIAEDRQTLRSVQFRFQPQRLGDRQVLAVTLRKPEAGGAIRSFELQQPMGDPSQPMPLQKVLQQPEFVAQLKDLDPAVRAKIEATLKTATLPAGTLKVEDSQ